MTSRSFRRRIAALAFLSATALSGAAAAQTVQTTVIADPRGPTGQTQIIDINQGEVFIDGGAIAGENQFYSFEQFDLAAGDIAYWQAPGSGTIANIINRVTGDLASRINGTIDTTALPGADFWFINPNGVLFGQGAQLNVPGTAYFSTGTEVRFADGDVFSARTPEGSTLSMSDPVAFGFLGGEADLAISGIGGPLFDDVELPDAEGSAGASFIGPNISVAQSGIQVGVLDLIASGTAQEVAVEGLVSETVDGILTIDQSDFLLRAALVSADGSEAPVGRLVGGNVTITDSNIVTASEIAGAAPNLAIGATSQLAIDNVVVASQAVASGAGGNITFGSNGSMQVDNSLIVSTTQLPEGGGNAGSILLTALDPVSVTQSTISSLTLGTAAGGSIEVRSLESINLTDSLMLTSTGFEGANGGTGGEMQLLSGGTLNVVRSGFTANTNGTGAGGTIYLEAADTLVVSDANFAAVANSVGNGGGVIVNSLGTLDVTGSQIVADTTATGMSGDGGIAALISAGDLNVTDSVVSTDTFGSGVGGIARVQSGGALALVDSVITADTVGGTGNGGLVNITAEGAISATNVQVFADTYGAGMAGNVILSSGETLSIAGGFISSESVAEFDTGAGFGSAGNVSLSAVGDLAIDGATVSSDTFGGGNGGGLFLESGGTTSLTNGTTILANTSGAGSGGIISVSADELNVTNSAIAAATTSSGDSAGLLVGVRKVTVGSGGAITSASTDSGNAGLVFIGGDVDDLDLAAEEVNVVDGGLIAASATGTGAAGSIVVISERVNVLRGGNVTAESANALPAGFIQFVSSDILIDGTAPDGSPSQVFSVNTLADPAPDGTNKGGDIFLEAERLTVSNGGILNSSSFSADAGRILIDMSQSDTGIVFLNGDALPGSIVTDSGQQGSGGIINILNAYAVIADNSEISASGDISNAFVLIDESTIRINSSDATNIVNVSGYSAVAPEQDVASGTTIVEVPFLDAAEVLANQCQAARARGKSNTLQIDRIGPYSLAPVQEAEQTGLDLASATSGRSCS